MGASERSKVPLNYTMDKEELIDSYCEYRGLNKSQATAVKTSINGLLHKLKPRIRLIQGPPGTGKTSTLATLLSILSSLKQRTLVCAPTNVAISEVILRFLKFFTATNQSLLFGQFCAEGEENTVRLGDMVLIGNDDRLDLEGPLEQLFLDHRVDRLIRALSPSSGWRASTSALVEFLKSASVQYETYKETHKNEPTSFMEFFWKRLKQLAEEFLDHCHVLCNDLPSSYTPASCVTVLEYCSTMVNKFLRSEFRDVDVRLYFRGSSTTRTSAFAKAVYELQDALTAMPNDVTLRNVPIYITEQRILEHACLVFSTVSSAGRHIILNSKPFECVIIDEASQCVEAATVVVTSMMGVKQMVLVGDQMQLPATVISQVDLTHDPLSNILYILYNLYSIQYNILYENIK